MPNLAESVLEILRGHPLVKDVRVVEFDETPAGSVELKVRCRMGGRLSIPGLDSFANRFPRLLFSTIFRSTHFALGQRAALPKHFLGSASFSR